MGKISRTRTLHYSGLICHFFNSKEANTAHSICCNDLRASLRCRMGLGPGSVNLVQQPSSQRSGSCCGSAPQDAIPTAPANLAGISGSQKAGLEGCLRGHYSFCHLEARSTSPQLFVTHLCSQSWETLELPPHFAALFFFFFSSSS